MPNILPARRSLSEGIGGREARLGHASVAGPRFLERTRQVVPTSDSPIRSRHDRHQRATTQFQCPKPECRAEYLAIHPDYPPEEKPTCSECGTPFLAIESGRYRHYRGAWDVVLLPPDQL